MITSNSAQHCAPSCPLHKQGFCPAAVFDGFQKSPKSNMFCQAKVQVWINITNFYERNNGLRAKHTLRYIQELQI